MKRVLVLTVVALSVTACAIGEARHESETYPARKVSAQKVCSSEFMQPDLSKLEACGNGQGHCYAADKVALAGLPECSTPGEICVPDKVLNANGKTLTPCKFFVKDKPGVCGSMLFGELAAHKDQIPPSPECDGENERCTPCIDPTNGNDTHQCDPQGVHVDACVGGATDKGNASCCHSAGVCMSKEAAPGDQADSLPHDTCGGEKVCAPAALVDGNPSRCYVLGLPGVCLDVCFASMLGPSAPVTRSDCRATEVCLPCVIGKGQGMPGC